MQRVADLRRRTPEPPSAAIVADALLADIEAAMTVDGAPEALHRLIRQLVPRWHFPMLDDDERHGAFESAIESLLGSDDAVLDIGAGSGILAFIAARAGARRVITCEESRVIAEVAREVIERNGYGDAADVLTSGRTPSMPTRSVAVWA